MRAPSGVASGPAATRQRQHPIQHTAAGDSIMADTSSAHPAVPSCHVTCCSTQKNPSASGPCTWQEHTIPWQWGVYREGTTHQHHHYRVPADAGWVGKFPCVFVSLPRQAAACSTASMLLFGLTLVITPAHPPAILPTHPPLQSPSCPLVCPPARRPRTHTTHNRDYTMHSSYSSHTARNTH